MTQTVADTDKTAAEDSNVVDDQDDKVNNKHVLRQAELARELRDLNAMLADKQQLAGQMMRSDEQLQAVRLQYEVRTSLMFLIGCIYSSCV